ncbi:hypothetical protein [Phaeobacter sp. B1627]|uniref:hypothetical protein n=1 Tax=Phaeobacter sp. B1627 TaxID=2583809 RepID=UPI001119A129|nr:hypothetical protein [Phaeobacter sp. B1627]TNJ42065.1 hypothetical protein FGE21_12440 [Phaeobacter sp. B1627]
MPNAIAYMMLLAWPVAALVFFQRLPLQRAILLCLIGGYLLLPPIASFDLPLVPDLDKFSISSLTALAGCLFVAKAPVPFLPRHGFMRVVVVLFVLCALPTVLTNTDAIVFQSIPHSSPIIFFNDQLPGLRWRDLGSVVIGQVIVLIPFFIARRYLSSPTAHRDLLLAFCIAGVIYAVPSLIEIRFSPQTNVWIYGFFQHDFAQMMRSGGFRPIVFLPHALWLALFMLCAVLAATALARAADDRNKMRYIIAAFFLFCVLFLCKSLASLSYGLIFTPVVALASFRSQIKLALIIAIIGCIYPMLRNTGVIPVEAIVAQVEHFSPERAQSLGYRFDNEKVLLERAAEKPVFGWGGWGRNLIHDAETGRILSIPDGHWIIAFGTFGWLGYLAEMSILAGSLALLFGATRKAPKRDISPYISCIALMLGATMIDMLLNDTLVPVTWMCAGAILGYAERLLYPDLFCQRPSLFNGRQEMDARSAGARLTAPTE